MRLPDDTGFDAGACLGIPALTACTRLLTDGGVAGQRVLVTGGAGAVGHYAIQFARLLGAAQVIATVSSDAKAAHARAAGADATVNYRAEDVAARVLDLTGGAGVDRVVEVDLAGNGPLLPRICAHGGDRRRLRIEHAGGDLPLLADHREGRSGCASSSSTS